MSLQQLRRATRRLGRTRSPCAAATAGYKQSILRWRFAARRSWVLERHARRPSLEAERLSPTEIAHSRARRLGAHSSLPDATPVRRKGAAVLLALLIRSAARNRFRQPAPFQIPSRRSAARCPDRDRRGGAQGRRSRRTLP